jgi:hypothetical protein
MSICSAARTGVALGLVLSVVGIANGDDGILYFQGMPHLLSGKCPVRMVQEYVHAKIGPRSARVYCRFVFRNEGDTVRLRIGFPDGNSHDGEDPGSKPSPSLRSFRSVIDGQPVATSVQRGTGYPFFHVKSVTFHRRQTRIAEDWYEVPLDVSATDSPIRAQSTNNYYIQGFGYTMASGRSWKGPIGKATVRVAWLRADLRHPKPIAWAKFGDPGAFTRWARLPKGTVIYSGFARPTVAPSSLVFRRRNFEPTRGSDIYLSFSPMPYKNVSE